MNSNLLSKTGSFDTAGTAKLDIAACTVRGNQPQEASIGSQIGPPVAEIFNLMYQQRLSQVKMADCGVFFSAQSPEPPILAS